eukprot:scaffold2575_cov214-Alexandrium_tamarense.AAC.14
MNTPFASPTSSSSSLVLGGYHGRYQAMTRTKDGKVVIVCRCCRIRDSSHRAPSSAESAYTPNSDLTIDSDKSPFSPEVLCLCTELNSLKIDAPRRSVRLSRTK